VKLRANKELRTATSFDLDIRLEADLAEDQGEEIFEEAKRCFVVNTLKGAPPRSATALRWSRVVSFLPHLSIIG
jgi:uncharacterized OsmC-like protein